MRARTWIWLVMVLVVLVGCGDKEEGESLFGYTITIIDETVKVSAGNYYAWSLNLDKGDMLKVDIDSDLDLNIYLLDSREYAAFKRGETFYADVQKSRVYEATIRYPVAISGTYYLVLDNRFSWFTPKTVTVLAKVST